MKVRITRGRNISVPGAPGQVIRSGQHIGQIAFLGSDVSDLPPDFKVLEGDEVAAGQVLFVDRKRPRIAFTSPISGKIRSLRRGHRRMLDTLIVEAEGARSLEIERPETHDAASVREVLLSSGLWSAFRERPIERIPDPDTEPDAIFVTAIDTAPLAVDPAIVLAERKEAFEAGLAALRHVGAGPLYVCHGAGFPVLSTKGVKQVEFSGPHPAGLPGTHIHSLMPAGRTRKIWHIGYQDVIEIGRIFETGHRDARRVISIAGPGVKSPGLVETVLGADVEALLEGQYTEHASAPISGSILSGRMSRYLGRYHTQISVPVHQKEQRRFVPEALSKLFRESGAIVPVAAYDRVAPAGILAVPMLRALAIGDVETAERLGCLELAEEDMALLTHVCPAGHDYGQLLRYVLNDIAEQM